MQYFQSRTLVNIVTLDAILQRKYVFEARALRVKYVRLRLVAAWRDGPALHNARLKNFRVRSKGHRFRAWRYHHSL